MGIPEKALVGKESVIDYIPQKPPFVMVSALDSIDEKSCTTSFLIKEDNIFCKDGLFTEPGLIENMAQSAALRIGFICKNEGKPVPLGFVASVSNLLINFLPKINNKISTQIIIENEVLDFIIIKGKISGDSLAIAEGTMKLYIKPD